MRKRSSWFAASLLVAGASASSAATVLEHTIVHTLRADGSVLESTRWTVRLDKADDLERWSPSYVHLDANRKLRLLEATSTRPGGKPEKVRRKDLDTVAVPDAGTLASSATFRTVEFPSLPVGSLISLESEVEVTPYFPAQSLSLSRGEAVESLSVLIQGAPAGFRYHLAGATAGFDVEPRPDGVRITARARAKPGELPHAPDGWIDRPRLHYAWGKDEGWAGVGRWYGELVRPLPRAQPAVRAEARRLIEGIESPRARVAALTTFVQEKVRYVSVQLGIGGYRPYPPHEVLAQLWGDCKAKAFLLLDLLAEAGIEAAPVLIRADAEAAVDPSFPTHAVFNHLIVAVPVGQLEVQAGDPVADGYFFVDPTLERGRGAWLHPSTQDQQALVVLPGGGNLVRTPVRAASEGSHVDVDLTVADDGTGSGSVRLRWTGQRASRLLDFLAQQESAQAKSRLAAFLGQLLPGAELGAVTIREGAEGLLQLEAESTFTLRQALQGTGGRRSLLVVQPVSLPPPWALEGRTVPVIAEPTLEEVVWTIRLPAEWCRPASEDEQVANALGTYRRRVDVGSGLVVLQRSLEIGKRLVAGDEVPALRELAVAEQRGNQRRLRFGCREAEPSSG